MQSDEQTPPPNTDAASATQKKGKNSPSVASSASWPRAFKRDKSQSTAKRRLEYMLLFRVGLLSFLALLTNFVRYVNDAVSEPDSYDLVFWSIIAAGYLVTFISARRLRKNHDPLRLAWEQALTDIFLAALLMQLTGGAESDFVFVFLVAILGSALSGDRRQTWAVGGASALIYSAASAFQISGWLSPLDFDGQNAIISAQVGTAIGRNLAAIVTMTVLSSYLNQQLARSSRQIGSLQALNEHIIRSLSSGLITIDLEGTITFVNPTARAILGHPPQLTGKSCESVLPGALAHCKSQSPHASTQAGLPIPTENLELASRFEIQLSTQKPARHLGLSSSSLLNGQNQHIGYIINFQDVTALRQLEKEVRRNERLVEIGSLATTVAHEVRNPLAAISGCAELLSSLKLNDDDQRLLEVIRRESSRLDRTVNDLLNFTRPATPNFVEIDIVQLTQDILTSFQSEAATSKVEVQFNCQQSPDASQHIPEKSLVVDPEQLSQVFWNLLRNGADAMNHQGQLEIEIDTRPTDSVKIEIRDHGQGISEDDQEHIFEPFFSTKTSGSGIGLAVVKRIIEDHQGSIRVDSRLNIGTTFTLTLPRRRMPALENHS